MIKLTDDELKIDIPAALAETETAIKALGAIVPEEAFQIRSLMRRAISAELDRDEYKRLYELRGKALQRPCGNCGHQPAVIRGAV